MTDTLITYKGLSDIAVGIILAVKPALVYESAPALALASLTGLHVSSPTIAPGFNQAVANLAIAVGVGHVVAARSGPAAHPAIFAMNATSALLGFMTCATPKKWGLGNATTLMACVIEAAFCVGLYFLDPRMSGRGRGKDKRAD